jgi:N-acetylglucosaminyldiphosphoundecaprenol N-acetyl-beta-D-mannosaminyltransferase
MISSGATFDFFGGRVRIAPRIIQRSGFEWLYRLLGPDFKRLLKRYTFMHGKFIWNFGLQLVGLKHRSIHRLERDDIRLEDSAV